MHATAVLDHDDLDVLLAWVTPSRRPWLQRALRAVGDGARRWARELPARGAAWGAGPDRAWCAW